MTHAVGILLTDPGNTGIWLSERIAPGDSFLGCQATPGGRVEDGETNLLAIIRELREETGIEWDGSGRMMLLITGEYDKPSGGRYVAHHFMLDTPETPKNTEDTKHGPWTFYLWEDLDDLKLMPSTRDAIKVAREGGMVNWKT